MVMLYILYRYISQINNISYIYLHICIRTGLLSGMLPNCKTIYALRIDGDDDDYNIMLIF